MVGVGRVFWVEKAGLYSEWKVRSNVRNSIQNTTENQTRNGELRVRSWNTDEKGRKRDDVKGLLRTRQNKLRID
jgi:hypothetical protein